MENKKIPLTIAPYVSQKDGWPHSGKHILAQFDADSIIVYQAYNSTIAEALVKAQNFHADICSQSGFSMQRMTWIKTNFLWMMYRSGWASKPNQERILAIRITRSGFDEVLSNAVIANVESATTNDQVRLQWDPDHLPSGEKLEKRRAIQLGLRGQMLDKMSREFIVRIDDITDFVYQNREYVNKNDLERLQVPLETVYPIANDELKTKIELSSL